MLNVKTINTNLFKKYKKFILVNGLIIVGSVNSLVTYKISDSQNLSYTKSRLEKISDDNCINSGPKDIDRLVWGKNEVNEDIEILSMPMLPTDTWNIRIFRGKAQSTYYRIEDEHCDEYSEWKRIPNNNLIVLTRKGLPKQMQYNKLLKIRFGKYSEKEQAITLENAEYFVYSEDKKEDLEAFNKARKRIELVAESLVEENDTELNKVKKIYDYLIEHTEYRWDGALKEITSLTIFNKYYMDCGGYAEFMNTALNHIGIESIMVFDSTHGHVWNIVNIDGEYYHLDATYSDTSSWENTSKYRYFLVSDLYMLADHRYFVAEKDVKCKEMYDLTGIVSQEEINHRVSNEQKIQAMTDGLLGPVEDGAYELPFRSK